jgi:F-type H+-transporting ATPase subunit b
MQINLFPDLSLLAVLVIFWVNYLVVKRYFFKPVNEILEARETETKTAETLYQESLARFNEATEKMEAELHATKREAMQVREKFRAEAAAVRAQMLIKTQTEAKGFVGQAEEKMKREIVAARETIKRESENLARLAAERILGRAV